MGSPAVAQNTRAPVELYNPTPLYPSEAAGSGVAPEVTVAVKVDDRGRVASVSVLRVQPSTDLDGVFASAVEETLRKWRYSPRYENGVATEAELRWTLGFLNTGQRSERPSGSDAWPAVLGVAPQRRTRSFFELPRERRIAALEELVQKGLGFLGPERVEVSSSRFTVRTDSSEESAQAIANNLEATYTVLESIFGEAIPIEADRLRVQVFAFSSRDRLDQFSAAVRHDEWTPAGFYSHVGLIAMHLQVATPADVLSLLLHEGTHAFVDRYLLRPGVRLPHWLSEGLAEYLANSEIKKGQLIPGKTSRSRRVYVRLRQAAVTVTRQDAPLVATLQEIKRAARQGESLTLTEVLDAGPERFTGPRRRLYYGMAWLMVHFLRHGHPDWQTEAFPNLLLFAAEGFSVSSAFEMAYRQSAAEIEPEFRSYLARF